MENQSAPTDFNQLLNVTERVGTIPPETNILKRALDILLRSEKTWPIIAEETGGLKEVFLPYSLYVCLVPYVLSAIASALLSNVAGLLMGASSDEGLPFSLVSGVMGYIYWVVGILFMAKVIEHMAPSYGLRKSWVLSARVLVYASTAGAIGHCFLWVPLLGMLFSLAGFVWGLLLAYQGLKIVLRPPVKTVTEKSNEPSLVNA